MRAQGTSVLRLGFQDSGCNASLARDPGAHLHVLENVIGFDEGSVHARILTRVCIVQRSLGARPFKTFAKWQVQSLQLS